MRIIAGQHKGRKLLSPEGLTTRPITDRVKTNLFNILGNRIPDALVLDLFSGTGSMGLEALSRGSDRCFFAERDPDALRRLRENIHLLGYEDCTTIWRGDIVAQLSAWLSGVPKPIDIAFVDPPYELAAEWDWQLADEQIFAPLAKHLAADGVIMLRCERGTGVPDSLGCLMLHDRRDYGHMSLVFYVLAPTGPAKALENDPPSELH